ncbi:hypothetical protein GGI20_001224 [Coemansia sp. BCRC 34301]|nr:hypothetical protein GGI20_001224 [Coemansia sp. BCRC 34301]
MTRIQLSSLHEFIASLSRLDYEAAKLASGRVMEDHIQMGALMFSLLTIEMMYTSMDYLTPSNFRRGNSYLINMYTPLPRRLTKLLKKIESEYEEEHERLTSLDAHPACAEQSAFSNPDVAHDDNSFFSLSALNNHRGFITDPNQLQPLGRSRDPVSAFHPVDRPQTGKGAEHWRWPDNERAQHAGAGIAEDFDPNRYFDLMSEAETVLQDLETVKQLVDFISKFVEVRKTMAILYRFIAVTGPALYVYKLDIMLNRCKEVLQTIVPNALYASLLDHVRNEVMLVCNLVDWNSHVDLHNIVKSVTSMKHTKSLLRIWQDALPSGAASMVAKPAQGTDSSSASHGLLYTTLAKSSRIVQTLLWGDSGRSSASSSQGPTLGRTRGIVVWIACWADFLTFKTTVYFQQILSPHRSLFLDEAPASGRQSAVLDDVWSRPGLPKANFHDMVMTFMNSYDGCFVSLLFESSKQRPYVLDGFAVVGSKVKVPDYRVQACAVLFCMANQKLLQARGHVLCGSLVGEIHSGRACSARMDALSGSQQYDVDWFRQNCLPDVLCVLDSDRATLELELLGSSPLLGQLGTDSDRLLVELCSSVDAIIEDAVAHIAETEDIAANDKSTVLGEWLSGDIMQGDRRRPDSMLGPEDDDNSDTDDEYVAEADAAAALHISIPRRGSQRPLTAHARPDDYIVQDGLEPGHAISTHSNDREEIDQANLDAIHVQDAGLSLYSTYLLKSHLRNNLPHDWQARNTHASRHFVGRQSGRAPMMASGRHDTLMAAQVGRTSSNDQENAPVDASDSAAAPAYPVLARRKTDDFQARAGHGAGTRPGSGRPVTMHATSGSSAHVKGAQQASQGDHAAPWVAEEAAVQRRQSIEPGLASDRRDLGARGSTSSTTLRVSRPALSIRSFFQSTPRLGVPARPQQSQQAEQKADESEVARRVHCGERLKDLFGPWHAHGAEEQAHDELGAPLGDNSRRGSVHSLSYSTHMRTSLGAKPAVIASAAMPNSEARGGGFAHRLSRAAAPLVTSAAATVPIASRGSEHQFGPSQQQQRAWAARGQNSRLFQQPDTTPAHPAAAAAAVPLPTMAGGGGLEGCTYLYSRASLPNIVMVAVLLDTERGLGRRREAERAWGEIVDAVRGTSMLGRLMALLG